MKIAVYLGLTLGTVCGMCLVPPIKAWLLDNVPGIRPWIIIDF